MPSADSETIGPAAPARARWPGRLAFAATMPLALGIFFHAQILNGFTVMFGDKYDAVIEISLLEHWFNVYRGHADWRVTGYFYPAPDTLGYNDGYAITGALYALFRAGGIDPFLAACCAHAGLKAIGFAAMAALARELLHLSRAWCLLAALLFTIANNSLMQSIHGQLLTVALAPLDGWLALRCLGAIRRADASGAMLWGAACAALSGAWLLTSFYMAWFFGFFAVLALLGAALQLGRHETARLWRALWRIRLALAAVAAVAALAITPLLVVYLPTARQTGMQPESEMRHFAIWPLDIVNVGAGNLLFGGVDGWLSGALGERFPAFSEWTSGFPPVILVVFAVALIASWRRDDAIALRARVIATVAAVTWVATMQAHGLTLWHVVWHVVPGARAVRVIARYQIFLAGPVVLTVLWWLSRLARRRTSLALALAALLIAEEINLTPPVFLDRVEARRFLASVPPPPAACQSFYAVHGRDEDAAHSVNEGIYSTNVDAMLLAELYRLPTLIGLSSILPRGWGWTFLPSDSPAFRRELDATIARYRLRQVCELDIRQRRWTPRPVAG